MSLLTRAADVGELRHAQREDGGHRAGPVVAPEAAHHRPRQQRERRDEQHVRPGGAAPSPVERGRAVAGQQPALEPERPPPSPRSTAAGAAASGCTRTGTRPGPSRRRRAGGRRRRARCPPRSSTSGRSERGGASPSAKRGHGIGEVDQVTVVRRARSPRRSGGRRTGGTGGPRPGRARGRRGPPRRGPGTAAGPPSTGRRPGRSAARPARPPGAGPRAPGPPLSTTPARVPRPAGASGSSLGVGVVRPGCAARQVDRPGHPVTVPRWPRAGRSGRRQMSPLVTPSPAARRSGTGQSPSPVRSRPRTLRAASGMLVPGPKMAATPASCELVVVLRRDHARRTRPPRRRRPQPAQLLDELGDEREVAGGLARHADDVHVVVDGVAGGLGRRLEQRADVDVEARGRRRRWR